MDNAVTSHVIGEPGGGPSALVTRVDAIVDAHGGDPSSLIQVLLEIQREYRWLPVRALQRISERLDVPLTRIRDIATFYKAFSPGPKGRHEVHVCVGTACHVRGASRILEKVKDVTHIGPGETDLELKFSVETVNCLGCCALGPVMDVDGKTRGNLTPAKTAEVLSGCE